MKKFNYSTLAAVFPYTIPVLTGYLFLGIAYGILIASKGFSLLWIVPISLFTLAGAMQFVTVGLLASGFHPLSAFLMTLMVNARHIFYGVSMLKKYHGLGRIKPYLIFGLTDETFSILCVTEPPAGIDRKQFLFLVTLLDHSYWIVGSAIGGLIGSIFSINAKGIDFVLTALFVVIFINQWKSTHNHLPVLIGLFASLICLIIFGASNFVIPAMLAILTAVTLLKKPVMSKGLPDLEPASESSTVAENSSETRKGVQ